MSAQAANWLRDRLGARTGVVVRTARKYLSRSGIEIVPRVTLDRPHGLITYFQGNEIGRIDADKCRTSSALVAAIYTSVAWSLHSASEDQQ